MDRYVKAVLTVIAGCLLVLVGNQIDFKRKLMLLIKLPGGDNDVYRGYGYGMVYFMTTGRDIIYCYRSDCQKVYEDDRNPGGTGEYQRCLREQE